VSHSDVVPCQNLSKVSPKLRAIVSLDKLKAKAKLLLGVEYDVCGQSWQDSVVYFGVGHPGVEVNNSVDVAPPFGQRADVVDRICLYQFAWLGYLRAPGIVRANPFLPGSVKAVVSPQNAADTAEANM
jgi:hypothetical protein